MGFLSVLSFAHRLVAERLKPGETAIDATAGTGADTLFLARTAGSKGSVFAFDIQEEALRPTKQRLDKESSSPLAEVTLIRQSHALMLEAVPMIYHGKTAAVMFNLGYLPSAQADKQLITEPDSTLTALEAAVQILRPGGVITAVLYPGHEGGDREAAVVEAWVSRLPQSDAQSILYRGLQRPEAPYLIALERK